MHDQLQGSGRVRHQGLRGKILHVQQARLGRLHVGLIFSTFVRLAGAQEETKPEEPPVRARFALNAPVALVEARACALRPIGLVDEKGHELDVQLPTRRCRSGPMPPDSIAVVVKIEESDGKPYVVLEAALQEGVPRPALEDAIKDMGLELKNVLEHPPNPPPSDPPLGPERMEKKRVWYGEQTLIADGISAGLCATIFGVIIGAPGLLLGAPIVHWVHGNTGIGFASLGMRAGLAGGGLGIGAAIGAGIDAGVGHGTDGATVGSFVGLITGTLVAIILDTHYFAYEEKNVPVVVRIGPEGFVGVF